MTDIKSEWNLKDICSTIIQNKYATKGTGSEVPELCYLDVGV